MRRLALWGRQTLREEQAIAEGFARLGWEVVWQAPAGFRAAEAIPCDLAVVRGVKHTSAWIRDHYEARGVPVVVLDLPPIRLDRFSDYYALWPGRLNVIPEVSDPSRMEWLGVEPEPLRPEGAEILLCGQVADDASHGLAFQVLMSWYDRELVRLRHAYPNASIRWRPHPYKPIPLEGADSYSDPEGPTLEEELRRPLKFVSSYNSTCGVVAMVCGQRAVCQPGTWYSHALDDPSGLVARLAWAQWSLDEIRSGEALEFAYSWAASRLKEAAA